MEADKAQEFAQYDLTAKLAPNLDRHLLFSILSFVKETGIYKKEDITQATIELLKQTKLLDLVEDQYKELGKEVPEAVQTRREQVVEEFEKLRAENLPMLKILEDEQKVKQIKNFKSVADLCEDFQLQAEAVEGLLDYALLTYDCGQYAVSSELLKGYRAIIALGGDAERPMTSKNLSCVWGSLAALILNREMEPEAAPESDQQQQTQQREKAAEVIVKLDEYLENSKMSKRELLGQRTWLLHWTLFAIFTPVRVEPKLLDFFLNEKSLSIISLSCPHLFRYVGACLILHKRLKHLVKDTVWTIHHESGSYSDPITRFLLALYTDMDFDEAQRELQACEKVCKGDYFLQKHWKDFEENARLLIFETYCRIHQCINIKMIASKLNMEAEEAELWIVKLIQNAKLDARIDSEKSRVVMSKAPPSVYQQVIEKTKNLSFRSTMLLANLEKRERDRSQMS